MSRPLLLSCDLKSSRGGGTSGAAASAGAALIAGQAGSRIWLASASGSCVTGFVESRAAGFDEARRGPVLVFLGAVVELSALVDLSAVVNGDGCRLSTRFELAVGGTLRIGLSAPQRAIAPSETRAFRVRMNEINTKISIATAAAIRIQNVLRVLDTFAPGSYAFGRLSMG